MLPDRSWMFRRKDPTGRVSDEFQDGVDDFIKFVSEHPTVFDAARHILCPCARCKNGSRMEAFWVEQHLYSNGFMANYVNWTAHGEERWSASSSRNVVDKDVASISSTHPGISSTGPVTSSSSPDRDTDVLHDRRKEIYVERPLMKRFRPTSITHNIMKEVMDRSPGFAPTWKNYPRDVKDALYAAFKTTYKFASPEDELLGRTVWDRTCQDRYPESIRNLRIAGLRKNNTTDIAQTKGNPPYGIKVEHWDQYVDYWLSEKFQRRSEATKANRRALPNAAVHSGGSVSFAMTQEKIEKEREGLVSMRDVYELTHKRKEKLDAGLAREYGDDPNEYPEVDPNICLQTVGSSKKGRVEGLGGSLSFSIGSCDTVVGPLFLQSSQAKQSEIHEMKQQMSIMQKNMQNMYHGQQAMQETMQQLLASLTPLLSSMAASRSDVGALSRQ